MGHDPQSGRWWVRINSSDPEEAVHAAKGVQGLAGGCVAERKRVLLAVPMVGTIHGPGLRQTPEEASGNPRARKPANLLLQEVLSPKRIMVWKP